MSKFMKFWLLIICFLFIFLILFTDRVKAETITNMRVWSVIHDNTITAGNYSTGNGYVLTNVVNGGCATCRNTIRVTLTNVGDNILKNKIVTFTFTHIGNGDLTEARLRDDANHIYACETYSNQTGGIVNVICPYVGDFNGGGEGFEFNTYGSYNARINISYFNYFNNDSQTLANIYSTLLQQQQQNNTNTQSIINNQNQNAQQQHNDAQQQYNYISNTTISNENYTNTQTISDNNTNTETKSVVMNFWLIPLNFFNSIIASFENTCTQVCVGECGSGHDNAWRFVFPCLDIKGFVGNTIYNTIDAFFAVGMIFAFVKRAKNFFINALMLTNDVASEVSVF